ncbi:four helix bundle protein [Clostridium saccharoperbutylacetonicum]
MKVVICLTNSIVKDKSFNFSLNIINTYKYLKITKYEYVLSKQLLRSGTSIGANVKEALRGESRRDFISKMNIALKEAEETEYWLELLMMSDYLDCNTDKSILEDCKELCKILTSISKDNKK